jgi:hypothetical protein
MGYRSDVAYKIQFHTDEAYWGFVAKVKLDPETSFCFEDDSFKQDDEDKSLKMYATQVKWYESYDDVDCHTKLWDYAEEYDRTKGEGNEHGLCSGYFIRIGEEYDDIETKDFGFDPPYRDLDISRDLIVNF